MPDDSSPRTTRRLLRPAVALVIAAAVVPVAGVSGAAGAAGARGVTLKDIAFSPARLEVARNTTVTFRWRDDGTVHNVRSVGRKRFTSIKDRTSGDRRVRFTATGTYRYVCTLHPGMAGRIIVR